jgi:CTP synthase (UTP-ammonia lyase)
MAMGQKLSIGIIGDFDPSKMSHPPTNESLKHAADGLGIDVAVTWLPTPSLVPLEARLKFDRFDAIWASSGSPYKSMDGAILGIKQARLYGLPLLAT